MTNQICTITSVIIIIIKPSKILKDGFTAKNVSLVLGT